MREIIELYLAFLKIGAVNFGGGYAMLPLLERELVSKRGWTTIDDLMDYFAIGQCTPGVIALNVSTFIGQFFDNFILSILTFMVFAPIFWDGFHWTFIQCLTCSLLGALLELVMEAVFSPIGYAITKNWRNSNVGQQYFDYINREGE